MKNNTRIIKHMNDKEMFSQKHGTHLIQILGAVAREKDAVWTCEQKHHQRVRERRKKKKSKKGKRESNVDRSAWREELERKKQKTSA